MSGLLALYLAALFLPLFNAIADKEVTLHFLTGVIPLASLMGIVAVVVACLGLFGLAVFTAQQKTKEIGIRKILGASAFNIYLLLSSDFLKWVTVANIVAWPIAYFFMYKWLQSFAFRTQIGWEIFLLSASIALIISIFTISFQSIKAARANPVDSLRYE